MLASISAQCKMRTLIFILLLISSSGTFAQSNLVEELYGFRLGQYDDVTLNELGEPANTIYLEDSSRVDFFYLNSDSTTHVGFLYLNGSNEIYSIQLTGESVSSTEFNGINLGDETTEVISKLGKPDTVMTQDFNDVIATNYFYTERNYSLVFNGEVLNSIKIWDPFLEPNYEDENFTLPELGSVVGLLKTNNRKDISAQLSSGLEIFYCDDIIAWKKSIKSEIDNAEASLFEFLFNEQYGLVTLTKYDSIPAEMNLRMIDGYGSFPVYKFGKETLFEEIVFAFQQGKYKVWEIKYKCDD